MEANILTHVTEFVTRSFHNDAKNWSEQQGDCYNVRRKPRVDRVGEWRATWDRLQAESDVRVDGFHFVVYITKPSIESLECMFGCLGAGLVVVPLNWRWSVKEMGQAVGDLRHGIVGIVVDEHFTRMGTALHETIMTDCRCIPVVSPLACLQVSLQDRSTRALAKAPNNVAFVVFTSGTGSKPKAAMLTHDNMIFQCYQKKICCGYSASDVYLHVAPLFHVGGLVSALAMTMVNAQHVFMPTPHFDAVKTLTYVREYNCTSFIAVPAMLKDLIDAHERCSQGSPLDAVERVLIGAGGLDPNDAARAQDMMPHATLMTAYGMTEACSSISYMVIRPGNICDNVQSVDAVYVGEIPSGIHLGVLNTHGNVHIHGTGELVTRGRHVFHSYYYNKQQSASRQRPEFLCDAGGNVWFRTGDLGVVSGRHVWLSGRLKDMIKSGGENVAAAEVERVLAKHVEIVDCSVYAIPDARWGEAVAAAIVVAPTSTTGQDIPKGTEYLIVTPLNHTEVYQSIAVHCRQCGLSPFKIPKYLLVCSSALPRNATGKIIKHSLQKETINRLHKVSSTLKRSKL